MPAQTKTLEHHGATTGGQSPLYQVWAQVKQRCYNKNCKKYPNYGGRGILMDPRWKASFFAFSVDLDRIAGPRPSKKHSLGRIDNQKGYFPDNVRWETVTEQNRNTRRNHLIPYDGGMKTLSQVSESTGIDQRRLQDRLAYQGLSPAEALKRPVERGSRFVEWRGEYHALGVWARKLGINYDTLHSRLHVLGWSVERAFTDSCKKLD